MRNFCRKSYSLYLLSSYISLIDGSPSPLRALRNRREKEAQRGEINMNTPIFRTRHLAGECLNDLCVYYKILYF